MKDEGGNPIGEETEARPPAYPLPTALHHIVLVALVAMPPNRQSIVRVTSPRNCASQENASSFELKDFYFHLFAAVV